MACNPLLVGKADLLACGRARLAVAVRISRRGNREEINIAGFRDENRRCLVREMGLEPTRHNHTHLKRACLPFQHSRKRLIIITAAQSFVNHFFCIFAVSFLTTVYVSSKNLINRFPYGGIHDDTFFCAPQELQPDFLVLTGKNAQHAKVLRIKCGEQVLVCDGQGRECLCTVSDVSAGQISLVDQKRQASESEAAVRASVYMAFAKSDKLEHVIQKATELGTYEIVALPSARCVSRPDDKSLEKKLERWQKIAASAA